MPIIIRRTVVVIQKKYEEAGQKAARSLIKVGVAAVVENPFANGYREDLSSMIRESAELGSKMAEMLLDVVPGSEIQSYGKGGVVGYDGEQEHANALLTSTFANPVRDAIGGGVAWISSMTKMGGPGTVLDVPMNHRDDVYVRSHYDGMTISLADAPFPDEIAVIFCVATGGRLNARVGGLTHEEVVNRAAQVTL